MGKLLSSKAKNNPNCGGETNYKKFKYKDIWFDSSWEVDLAKWMDERGIQWERSRKNMFFWVDENKNNRRYYPDFYLADFNIYLDPKNKFLQKKDAFKLEKVRLLNNINLISGDLDFIKEQLDGLINIRISNNI